MSDPYRDIRIGDAERSKALQVLGEHMSAGRIDINEYGDRSAKITTAKTRGELMAQFADLPDPRPQFSPLPVFEPAPRLPARKWEGMVIPAVGIAVVLVFFLAVRNPLIFLLVPAVAILWGTWNGRRR